MSITNYKKEKEKEQVLFANSFNLAFLYNSYFKILNDSSHSSVSTFTYWNLDEEKEVLTFY